MFSTVKKKKERKKERKIVYLEGFLFTSLVVGVGC
jgi:hypothetical protein